MALSTLSIGVALTPTIVSTLFSHYLNRKTLHNKPNVHLSYDEGISVVREFINFSSKRPIEYIQEFTSQRVPAPHWVKIDRVPIPEEYLTSAATVIIKQLGPDGVARVGGEQWWQWRGPSGEMKTELKGEWIEMRNDYNERKRVGRDHPSQKRIILYIHGGAYYFGSVETHRYQLQRHARKLKGRVFAPEYRLAPQFPFPCSLQDSLAAFLYLLQKHSPNEIIFAGDSAGGGMILSMLVICRDQGLPLPAGAILISPWVDLTNSFPSIVQENPGDYIPPHGFLHKPSLAWPPPNEDEIQEIKEALAKHQATSGEQQDNDKPESKNKFGVDSSNPTMGYGRMPPSFVMNGKTIEVKDQIHVYTTNDLLFHPLVSPIFQPSLGGLPPLQIISGGGEMLRDEQFYLAHKAANPSAYPPNDTFLEEFDPKRKTLYKYPGTYVQLQVWDDLCHVAPILSFTRPAKYMFRSIAQFGAWALARAQDSTVEIVNDDEISPISSSDTDSSRTSANENENRGKDIHDIPGPSVGKAGDPLPAFKDRMIRQGVNKRGHIYPLDPPHSCPVLQTPPSSIGTINPGLLMKWMLLKEEWDHKFAKEKARIHKLRIQGLAYGFQEFDGETPPPSSLAARRLAPGPLPPKGLRTSYPMAMWSKMASKHDKKIIKREQETDNRSQRTSVEAGRAGASIRKDSNNNNKTPSFPVEEINGTTTSDEQHAATNGKASDSTPANPSDKPSLSPLIILPNYKGNPSDEYENASTRALFHVPGTISSAADAQSIQPRPSSHAGTATVRSGLTSEAADDASTIGDERSLAATGMGVDAASTRAVLNARGVIGLWSDESSVYHSVDSPPISRVTSDAQK